MARAYNGEIDEFIELAKDDGNTLDWTAMIAYWERLKGLNIDRAKNRKLDNSQFGKGNRDAMACAYQAFLGGMKARKSVIGLKNDPSGALWQHVETKVNEKMARLTG